MSADDDESKTKVYTEKSNITGSCNVTISPPKDMSLTRQNYDSIVNYSKNRYPHSIVWTPIPCLTWFFPFIGHMGICMCSGVIRDFAGPYHVSEDCMAFGNPTKYWQLDTTKATGGQEGWDRAVADASEEYKGRMHNLCCDNCHSHVAMALNLMQYDNKRSWNMVNVTFWMLVHGKYISFCAFLKTWLPFIVLCCIIVAVVLATYL